MPKESENLNLLMLEKIVTSPLIRILSSNIVIIVKQQKWFLLRKGNYSLGLKRLN